MMYMLRHLPWYLGACFVGAVALYLFVPFFAVHVLADHMPWRHSMAHAEIFGHYAYIRAWMMWAAASFAAVFGFFMVSHAGLRRAILILPAWTPVLYVVIYLALVFE